ncbi:MAG: hypothetical protein JWP95_683 [Actinotalea sp.]|nr:hypothetical protein [Actinotalea sp.]
MFVLTIDQQGSRRRGDQVEELLPYLSDALGDGPGVVRRFERTVGDEVQAVLDDAGLAVSVALAVLRLGGWSVGVGAGPVDEPLPPAARAGSGPAFVLARAAVERAKSRLRPVPVAVEAVEADRGRDCEAVLTVVGAIMARRTAAGWAVIDALAALSRTEAEATQDEVAAHLGVTQQAVSQRLRAAMWQEEQAVRPVAARLLAEGDG